MNSLSSSSKLCCFLIPIFLCFVSSVISQPPDFLAHSCVDNGKYTNNSTYQTNLINIFSTIINSNTQIDYGFYNFSSGNNLDSVHAIALCRGDITVAVCKSCLKSTIQSVTRSCPYYKEAIGWYTKCMLRYSTSSTIFGKYAFNDPSSHLQTTVNVTNTSQFGAARDELIANLSSKASLGDSRRKFATGEVSLANLGKMYGLVQCTPDLTRRDCSLCLNQSFNQILGCCDKRKGAIFLASSCNVRFEMYSFYEPDPDPVVAASISPSSTSLGETTVQTNITNASGSKSNNTLRTIIISVVSIVASVVLIVFICIYLRWRKPQKSIETMSEAKTMESLQYNLSTIKFATNDFSDANKLGQGGFGAVYKGTLRDGREIAVKRLKMGSGQGDKEFKTEVMLVAKLQHRNLVRLLGFCLEGDERLLIYEFVPNKSLDNFLFDRVKRSDLNWETRYKMIGGIVKGLLYLHEDSRLRIIHRDLKASNILLDKEMNPKIADFGLAKLLITDQTHADTSRIVGTYGYMAPEYAMRGHFSLKSDIYSFGVLVLEIVSGDKISSLRNGEESGDLISYAWESWTNGTTSTLIDPTLLGGSKSEILRCIHVGLLCVQENVSNRPTIASIAMMLNNHFIPLPKPSQPSTSFMPNYTDNDSNVTAGLDNSWNCNAGGVGHSIDDLSSYL